jgi:NTP pyrophosphatase (non-canonical NTP hydrolase)
MNILKELIITPGYIWRKELIDNLDCWRLYLQDEHSSSSRFATEMEEMQLNTFAEAQAKDIDKYSEFVDQMWLGSPDGLQERDFRIMELGLPGEVGEVLELLKKNVRDGVLDRDLLRKELGDVAYYWARICTAYGFKPSEVLIENVAKLEGRADRNTLQGSGDNR